MSEINVSNPYDISLQPREYCDQFKKAIRVIVAEFESNINSEMDRIVQQGTVGNNRIQKEQFRDHTNQKLEYLRSVREELLPSKYPKLEGVKYNLQNNIGNPYTSKPEPMSSYFKVFFMGNAILVCLGFISFLILVL